MRNFKACLYPARFSFPRLIHISTCSIAIMHTAGRVHGVNLGATMDVALNASRSGGGPGGANVPLSASFRGLSSGATAFPLQPSFGHAQLASSSYRRSPVQGALTMLDDTQRGNQSDERAAVSDDVVRLQSELQANRAEENRLRTALHMHESVIQKNREELNRYKAYMDTRDNEMRQSMQMEEDRLQKVLDEYKHRYERERQRLQEALVKAANCAQVVSDGLTQCLAIERELFGYRFFFATATRQCSRISAVSFT